jgi:hypothetical protein
MGMVDYYFEFRVEIIIEIEGCLFLFVILLQVLYELSIGYFISLLELPILIVLVLYGIIGEMCFRFQGLECIHPR